MRYLNYKKWILPGLALFAFFSCSKQDASYKDFISTGPIVYPGKADSVYTFGGNDRILLTWAAPNDLNITRYKIFWNFGGDSVEIQGRTQGNTDSVKVYLDSLAEGTYGFTVYSYDQQGHKSVGTTANGNVYGSVFASTIFNRPIQTLTKSASTSTLKVIWVGRDSKCIGTQWNYTNNSGLPVSFFDPIDDTLTIQSCNVAKPVSYRSLFVPEVNAIDTFYTDYKSL